ncbi:hypothetical protein HAT86_06935 [Roseovarius gahaiensis]|uniref:Uncharacterized protein n=1 Tax=Roseovarius gahaiensis TaxID=2716691 RepID=A0A967BBT2_9RHOB|nr:hypothetical protein [Roseovarius gahaiensis]NHQ74199.1 hypothetical protein [Roseovarius gahaiensis]
MQRSPSWSPDQPLPKFADKVTGAAIITHLYFPISPRTLERWPITVRRPNKAAIYVVDELLAFAERKMKEAPVYKQERCGLCFPADGGAK